jgi:hypothetical protein
LCASASGSRGSLTEVIAGIDTEAVQDAMREVLADNRPTIDREARWSHGSQERALSISLLPLEGADGRPLGVCSVALDFSNSKARDHLDLLREASVRLGSTLDVMKPPRSWPNWPFRSSPTT